MAAGDSDGLAARTQLRLVGSFAMIRSPSPASPPTAEIGSRRAPVLPRLLLAVERAHTVSVDAIAEVLGGANPPVGPAENIATLVSRLRRPADLSEYAECLLDAKGEPSHIEVAASSFAYLHGESVHRVQPTVIADPYQRWPSKTQFSDVLNWSGAVSRPHAAIRLQCPARRSRWPGGTPVTPCPRATAAVAEAGCT